jgi:histidinol-phosphate/aromatic aminotransferase/cobyric acid decarboxylase-like protein
MTFPLGAWIDDHSTGCRHNLALSGMVGSVPPPPASKAGGDPEELRVALGHGLGVAPERLFLTHGATEANALLATYLRARKRGATPVCRVRYPEYPPLFDLPRAIGYRLSDGPRAATLAVLSQPRNPEGDLWPLDRLAAWADGADHLLVDETFREFGPSRSLATTPRPRLWTSGTFTKFYGGDDLRVGYLVAPPEEVSGFRRFHGVAADEVAPRSIAGALALLERGPRFADGVRRIVERNRRVLGRALPGVASPVGPVHFDRAIGEPSERLAGRCLAASVLVCPGGFFGDARGVRLCLTRRSFPDDLAAYLAVRDRHVPTLGANGGRRTAVRPRRGGSVRSHAERG